MLHVKSSATKCIMRSDSSTKTMLEREVYFIIIHWVCWINFWTDRFYIVIEVDKVDIRIVQPLPALQVICNAKTDNLHIGIRLQYVMLVGIFEL